jgi:hypothetical protein
MPKRGQRAKMSTLSAIQPQGKNKVLHKLSCGHQYTTNVAPLWTLQASIEYHQQFIGKREKCDKCSDLL